MLLATVNSINGVPIRFTKERWEHIRNSHPEILEENLKDILNAISSPDMVLRGDLDELLAVKNVSRKTWIVVPYKEVDPKDGFILTAYLTTSINWLFKKEIIWNKD